MEFGLVWCRTGCLLTPLVSIQNPGSSKQVEVCPRVVRKFQLFFPALKKKQSPRNSWTQFFFEPFLPHVWDSVFFQSWNFRTTLGQTYPCLLEPGFWILTKGVKRQPVRHQTRPNSTKCWGWSNLGIIYPLTCREWEEKIILNVVILGNNFPQKSIHITCLIGSVVLNKDHQREMVLIVLDSRSFPTAVTPTAVAPTANQFEPYWIILNLIGIFWTISDYSEPYEIILNDIELLSRPGRSQGLLYKQPRHSLIQSLIKWVILFLPQLYGATTPKRLEIALPILK